MKIEIVAALLHSFLITMLLVVFFKVILTKEVFLIMVSEDYTDLPFPSFPSGIVWLYAGIRGLFIRFVLPEIILLYKRYKP